MYWGGLDLHAQLCRKKQCVLGRACLPCSVAQKEGDAFLVLEDSNTVVVRLCDALLTFGYKFCDVRHASLWQIVSNMYWGDLDWHAQLRRKKVMPF